MSDKIAIVLDAVGQALVNVAVKTADRTVRFDCQCIERSGDVVMEPGIG